MIVYAVSAMRKNAFAYAAFTKVSTWSVRTSQISFFIRKRADVA